MGLLLLRRTNSTTVRYLRWQTMSLLPQLRQQLKQRLVGVVDYSSQLVFGKQATRCQTGLQTNVRG